MRNSIILLLLCYSLSISGATYYIDPSGNDSNNGSSGSPWKTLAYACSKATSSGDVIHVNAGTYTETVQSALAVGVSIEGAGITSIIRSTYASDFTILLSSGSVTAGNQHISSIKMDGVSLTAYAPIHVYNRSNVAIYNCTFIDFYNYGVGFEAYRAGSGNTAGPVTYATGNSFHDNIVTNCSVYLPANDPDGDGHGLLGIGGQSGMLIYNNTLTQTARSSGSNGYLIKYMSGGFCKDIKIYNNTLTKNAYDGVTWDFAIEMWNVMGGIEIYNNTITAGIDISGWYGATKGAYAYSVWIHNNTLGPTAICTTGLIKAIYLEIHSESVIIERNYIKNVGIGVYITLYPSDLGTVCSVTDINIRYNIFNNIGVGDAVGSGGWGISFNYDSGNMPNKVNNFNVYNNVIIGHIGASSTYWGIQVPDVGTVTNVSIRNNIVENFNDSPVHGAGGSQISVDYLSIEKNIFYNNGNSNAPHYSSLIPTNNTTQNNLTSDPLFVSSSDFHLQSGSPAIGKGLAITGLTTDYAGNAVKNPPCIGAYENYLSALPVYQNSVVENVSPALLQMSYNLSLTNIVPANSAFNVQVNSVARIVNSVSISGNKVQLTLESAIKSGDIITVSYTKPSSNPLQTSSGGQATSISYKSVTNNCKDVNKANEPPVVVVNYPKTAYAGFISEIDATSTYDPDNDPLIVEWVVPNDVPVSTVKSFKTEFLAPLVDNSKVVDFQLKVSDGITVLTNDIPITVLPYKPELAATRIKNIEASDFQPPDYPNNVLDGNTATKWSSIGDNKWLLLTLAGPFKLSHLVLAFLQGQQYESYFDIYASKDNLIWEPILTKAASCNFSGERQVFDFPFLNTNTEYSYLKYVGHGNSLDNLNTISEIKIFGSPRQNSNSDNSKEKNVIIYPNPAGDFFYISIEEPTMEPDKVRIIDLSGKIVFEKVLNPVIKNIQIPISLKSAVYLVELSVGNLILFTQKLIVMC